MPAPAATTVLRERYQVLRRIGRGGMGAVYEALDLTLHNVVAVKHMTACGWEADQAFEREARLLAALRYRALPVVIDAFTEDGSRFLVMQYIEGEDLEARLRRTGPCAESDVMPWAVAVLEALDYLHSHTPPIVHRDIKPSNIKLTPRGEVVLLDFGLAKGRTDPDATHVTAEASIFGFTPSYAPLEQLEARGTDPRSDLYALGATLFHLVTGAAPPTAGDRAAAVVSGRPDPLTTAWPPEGVSAPLRDALTRALKLDKEGRFQSAREMLAALDPAPEREPAIESRPDEPRTGVRRIDAAAPSQAEVGRPLDVIVQVRFADSPLLGLEDWPSRRRPDQIEQASENVHLDHPQDPRTGRELPARLRVALVAPDFEVRGASEYIIDVPPHEYSKRLVFLLTPRRVGYCRVHVEVYTAAESVLLGTIPVETEAVAEVAGFAPVRAADLVLGVMAAPADLLIDGVPEERSARDGHEAALRELARGGPPRDEATPVTVRVPAATSQAASVPPVAPSAAAVPPSLEAPVSSSIPPASAASAGLRLPRWAYSAATLAVIVTSVVVWRAAQVGEAPPDLARVATPGDGQQAPATPEVASPSAAPAVVTPDPIPPAVTEALPVDPPAPALMSTVYIDLRPWARVKIVPATPNPAIPNETFFVPFAVDLPAGDYILEAENGGVTRAATFQLRVAAGGPQTFMRSMPGFNATKIVEGLLGKE